MPNSREAPNEAGTTNDDDPCTRAPAHICKQARSLLREERWSWTTYSVHRTG